MLSKFRHIACVSKDESRGLLIYGKNINFEYAHLILGSNDIEPPIAENHNRMQIITSFAYCMHIINCLVCNMMHEVHIWYKIWIYLEILCKMTWYS